ncbi:CocE/NonD family hydrolase [Microbacterium sp. 2MCAF23]|uniref:CocE/NonD family hydrolase n=1 Tax=Microbacterium sp. 2MCAF23 TaxID=3232985 RepID=UPI003F9D79AB
MTANPAIEEQSGSRAEQRPDQFVAFQSADSVVVEFDVPAVMRDGVVLRADIYRPAGEGSWPTLLVRTPYDKGSIVENAWNGISPTEAAQRGFIVVIQDVRGRHASDGVWEPGRYEGRDGADTIAWAAELPSSNGRVGMIGGSYCGNTQLMAAIEQPPALKAITPLMTWSEPRNDLVARGGAVELAVITGWSLIEGLDWLTRLGLGEDELEERSSALLSDIERLVDDGYWGLPVNELPVLRRHGTPVFVEIGEANDFEATHHQRVQGQHGRIQVPSFFTTGWFDSLMQGTLDNYMAMRALGRQTRLIIAPWSHSEFMNMVGDRDFGISSMRDAHSYPSGAWSDEILAFLRDHLVDDAPAKSAPPVQLFVMGRNEWRDEDAWPLERAHNEQWNLHADGGLSMTAPAVDAAPSEIYYDPADPVPTFGGVLNLSPIKRGPVDQAPIEGRLDVLVFTSDVLTEDLEVTGPVRVRLHVQSSAPSTDWVARLCDVEPDGRSLNLTDGIFRIESGADELQEIEIDLWSTSNVFLAGHRLRVQITNSCFPRWDRNLNTGDQRDARFVTARQRLYHDTARPSYIELPVVAS